MTKFYGLNGNDNKDIVLYTHYKCLSKSEPRDKTYLANFLYSMSIHKCTPTHSLSANIFINFYLLSTFRSHTKTLMLYFTFSDYSLMNADICHSENIDNCSFAYNGVLWSHRTHLFKIM